MKKIAFIFALLLTVTTAGAKIYHYDVNKDGTVSVSDVTFLVNKILGVPNVEEDGQNYVYDVNGDDVVNVSDVTCLVNKILGILNPDEELPSFHDCPDDNHPHMIDLGLPSGTLWACCNVNTERPEEQSPSNDGGYYAWGETEVRGNYNWNTYTYGRDEDDCDDFGSGIAGTEYDVAHVKWGDSWVMPSPAQFEELMNECSYNWFTVDGVEGALFTGPSGGTIFLPAAGYVSFTDYYDVDSRGYYWSSAQDPSKLYYANYLYFSNKQVKERKYYLYSGLSVRPVISPKLQLSKTSLQLLPEGVETVDITSGSGNYTLECSAPGVVTATLNGAQVTVTATGSGKAVITVTDTFTGSAATIKVAVVGLDGCPDANHPHLIDLGLPSGTKWACCNMDTEAPEAQCPSNYGGYYAWGETEVHGDGSYTWDSYAHGSSEDDCEDLGADISGTQYDVAHVNWGGFWAMPSSALIEELVNECTYTRASMNGVVGVLFTGPNGGTIFLPYAGYRRGDNLSDAGKYGYYWSSTQQPSLTNYAFALYLSLGVANFDGDSRASGFTVRPVSAFSLSTTTLNLLLNTTETVNVTLGSGSYSVESSDEGVATATVDGTQIMVTGIDVGSATITVTDLSSGMAACIQVMVDCNLELSTSTLSLAAGLTKQVEVTSGTGIYEVTSNNVQVANAVDASLKNYKKIHRK